jgi:hypothetical protein
MYDSRKKDAVGKFAVPDERLKNFRGLPEAIKGVAPPPFSLSCSASAKPP